MDEETQQAIKDWQSPIWNANPDGGFLSFVFLQLLFGYCSLNALHSAFSDVWLNDKVAALVNALFPCGPS